MNMISRIFSWLQIRFGNFTNDQRGISTVEFVIILPVMLTVALSGHEVTSALSAKSKVEHATAVIGDLASQTEVLTEADIIGIFEGAKAMVYPYPNGNLRITIAGIAFDNNEDPTIAWQRSMHGGAPINLAAIPDAISQPNAFIVMASMEYSYTPAFGNGIVGSVVFDEISITHPRKSKIVGIE
ncbi:MAG: pilus assembly protein [Cohaesibacteraceae bacterium]|nr:pilus assembly protein [Cohaesibacteraceae bacterium]MBL4876453.1 pilus assembly protein [Cohaesibacteraceae bacterium]